MLLKASLIPLLLAGEWSSNPPYSYAQMQPEMTEPQQHSRHGGHLVRENETFDAGNGYLSHLESHMNNNLDNVSRKVVNGVKHEPTAWTGFNSNNKNHLGFTQSAVQVPRSFGDYSRDGFADKINALEQTAEQNPSSVSRSTPANIEAATRNDSDAPVHQRRQVISTGFYQEKNSKNIAGNENMSNNFSHNYSNNRNKYNVIFNVYDGEEPSDTLPMMHVGFINNVIDEHNEARRKMPTDEVQKPAEVEGESVIRRRATAQNSNDYAYKGAYKSLGVNDVGKRNNENNHEHNFENNSNSKVTNIVKNIHPDDVYRRLQDDNGGNTMTGADNHSTARSTTTVRTTTNGFYQEPGSHNDSGNRNNYANQSNNHNFNNNEFNILYNVYRNNTAPPAAWNVVPLQKVSDHEFISRFLAKELGAMKMEMSGRADVHTTERRHVRTLKKKKRSPKKKGAGETKEVEIPSARYYTTIEVGSQDFRVTFDTGSSDIWLPSIDCTTCGSSVINVKSKFDEHASDTFKRLGNDYNIGDGLVTGEYVSDTVSLVETFTIKNQTFALIDDATGMSKAYAASTFDGVLGLALNTNVLQNAREQGVVEKKVFALNLSGEDGGKVTFGEYDYSKHVDWVKLSMGSDLWQIEIDGINMGAFKATKAEAIVDSGSALIIGPASDVSEIAEEVGATKSLVGNYIIDCENIGNIPDLTFTIDGNEYTVPGSKLVIQSSGVCLLAIESHADVNSGVKRKGGKKGKNKKTGDEKKNHWVLGEVFMSVYYTVFDAESKQKQVGFAVYE